MNNMTPDEMAEQIANIQYIATGVASYQISEDRWQVSTLTKIFEAGATIAQIFEWAKRKHIDLNTIQVHQNEK